MLLISRLNMAKESMSLEICQQKLPKPKNKKEEECGKVKQNSQGLWENFKTCNINLMVIPGRVERKEQKNYLK